MPIIPGLTAQYAEQAAFLWVLRDASTSRPDDTLADLAALDQRLEAHLDGLRIAGPDGWVCCAEGLTGGQQGGEVFTAAVLAWDGADPAAVGAVCMAAEQTASAAREVVSALGWLSVERFSQCIPSLLAATQARRRRLAIAACAVRREDCGSYLTRALADPDPRLRQRAARAVGELARLDLAPTLTALLTDADPGTGFWSAWSLALLGEWKQALGPLAAQVRTPGPDRWRALQIVARIIALDELQPWLAGLSGDDDSQRLRIAGLGAGGDPAAIPWLIAQLGGPPALARVAGESLRMITGVALTVSGLTQAPPQHFRAGPTDDPADDVVTSDPDQGLPWPAADRVAAWWQDHQGTYQPGQRYLAGQPIAPDHCRGLLRSGRLRERQAAALELALMDPAAILYETRSPGYRQGGS